MYNWICITCEFDEFSFMIIQNSLIIEHSISLSKHLKQNLYKENFKKNDLTSFISN